MRHPRFPVAVHVLLFRGDEILLVRRCNTGFEDGKLSVPAGHVEPGESVTSAAIRETREEVGVELAADRRPENCEPDKCSELLWADRSRLPDDTIPYVRAGIENAGRGVWFQEFGWT